MIRIGSTPTITATINGVDFNDLKDIKFTFRQGSYKLEKHIDDMELDNVNKTISFKLTQEETLKFNVGTVKEQIRVLFFDGTSTSSDIEYDYASELIDGGVLE